LYFIPSDITLALDEVLETHTGQTVFTIKSFVLRNKINPLSKFRFSYQYYRYGGTMYSYFNIYRNNIAIGTEVNTASSSPITQSEDLTATNWQIGDIIALKCWGSASDNVQGAQNFYIKGTGSQWEKL